MNGRTWLNLLFVLGLLVSCVLALRLVTDRGPERAEVARTDMGVAQVFEPLPRVELSSGTEGIRDARGVGVEIGDYGRIVAASSVAADVLRELVDASRIVAVPSWAKEREHSGWKFEQFESVGRLADVEQILALNPDIVFYNSHADPAAAERLAERGVRLFDLGPMTGFDSLLNQAHEIATLLSVEPRFELWAATFARRIANVPCQPIVQPRRAAYVSTYGTSFFGGTSGSSFHDIILAAGLVDHAAESFDGWPDYSPEELLTLNPPWIVTSDGGREQICSHVVLKKLEACANGGAQVVEMNAELLGDPGVSMLDAAEQLHELVYGTCARGAK